MNAPRPGWLVTAADEVTERGLNVSSNGASPATPETVEGIEKPAAEPVMEPETPESTEDVLGPSVPATEDAVDVLARAIVRSFSVAGRGFNGNRSLIESDTVLRQYLAEDGVIFFDDQLLSAALTVLETATLKDSNARLVRGTDLHRRNGGSRYTLATPFPPRAMLLEELSPFNYAEFERADIEPYLTS